MRSVRTYGNSKEYDVRAMPPHEDGNGFYAAIQRRFRNPLRDRDREKERDRSREKEKAFKVTLSKTDSDIFLDITLR